MIEHLAAIGISKRYEFEVLRDCTVRVEAGECVTIRGPSGGGKSTLLRIIARLDAADQGTVAHGSRRMDAAVLDDEPVYPFLTLVFQQLFLWPNLTISENLAIVLSGDPSAEISPAAFDLLDRLTLSTLLSRKPHECSVGQRQRVAVARALLSDAKFLLLDEPSAALDRANRQLIAQELLASKISGRGILIVTHDERDFDHIADRHMILDDGRLETF